MQFTWLLSWRVDMLNKVSLLNGIEKFRGSTHFLSKGIYFWNKSDLVEKFCNTQELVRVYLKSGNKKADLLFYLSSFFQLVAMLSTLSAGNLQNTTIRSRQRSIGKTSINDLFIRFMNSIAVDGILMELL